jgi:hypothetical protein
VSPGVTVILIAAILFLAVPAILLVNAPTKSRGLYRVTIAYRNRSGKIKSWSGNVRATSQDDAAERAGAQIMGRDSVVSITNCTVTPAAG